MANVKNYGLSGIGSDVQFGKSGGRLIYDTSSSFFKFTTDGTTLAQVRVATTPSNANDIASKSYVDSTINGLDVKESVHLATTAAGTLATSFANGETVDGVALATGDRILIKDQADASENGVYTVNASGAPTRATDFDADSEVTAGAFFFVEEGTTNGNNGFTLTTNDDITVGTTDLTFTQFSGSGQITAGTGMTKSGNTLNVVGGDGIVANANDLAIDLATNTALAFDSGKLDVTIDLSDSTNDVTGTLAIGNGGTGQTSLDDIVAGSNKVSITNGTGTVIGGDATIDITESNLDLGNMGGTADLTSQVTGVLPVANGGTGGANAGAARTALGLAIGSDVQAFDAQLSDVAGLTPADGAFIVGNGSNFVAETGATARTSLGLGTGDTPTFNGAAMGSAAITGVADPSNAQDAATKAYVDGLVGAGSITQALGADSGSGSVSLGSQTLTVSGTANAITTSASGQAITIDIADNPTFTGNATITGNLTVQGTTTTVNSTEITIQNAFTFEGATADAHETTLTVVDPTADRTITLPNASGSVVLNDNAATLTNKTIAFGNNTISGQLSLANGGTGQDLSAIAQGTILVAGAGNTLGSLTIGGANKYLRSTGTTASYDYVTALRDNTDGNVVIEADTANIADNTKLQIRNTSSNVSIHAIDPDDSTANVNLVLESQGTGGRVLIRDASGGSSVIIGDDDSSLTVSGGASSSSDAGDLVIKGGNGTGSNASGDAIIKGGTGGSAEGKVKITDSSDNEIAIFERTASAVNEFTITNNATGSNPSIAATGGDTNISVALTPKGNGLVVVPNGYESNVGSVDDALVTRRWVLDNVVTATDDLTLRAAISNGNDAENIGSLPNASGVTYYVTRIAINVTQAYAGGSVDSMLITDGSATLATVSESDVTTTGSYIVDLDGATATAGGATLAINFKQSNGTTAATPTSGAMTVFVEYKATT
tara:strand:+ start:1006 stop:3858 length:2853 start_codon:yes stop_codon:yes gene_type:complete